MSGSQSVIFAYYKINLPRVAAYSKSININIYLFYFQTQSMPFWESHYFYYLSYSVCTTCLLAYVEIPTMITSQTIFIF